jgi:hypothetical protein
MVMDHPEVTLATIGGGAAVEKFDDELLRVVENIMDPNTDLKEREVVLKVKIKPMKERGSSTVEVSCFSKLRPAESFCTQFYMGRSKEGIKVFESNPQQMLLPTGDEDDESEPAKVVPISSN